MITGTRLGRTTAVMFGAIAGTSLVVIDDETLSVSAPVAPSGVVDLTVQSPAGDVVVPGGFRFQILPIIMDIIPGTGPAAGGTAIAIQATHGATGAIGASFGGVPATDFVVVDDMNVTCTTPPGTGTVDVVVSGPSNFATFVDGFTYDAP